MFDFRMALHEQYVAMPSEASHLRQSRQILLALLLLSLSFSNRIRREFSCDKIQSYSSQN